MELNKYHEMAELEEFHWWFVYRQSVLDLILKKYLFKFDKGVKIVDIGCGTGGNIRFLSKNYNNIMGIDNNEFAINYCREKNLNVIKGELPDLNFIEDNSVDFILIFDVLEHIQDDKFSLSVLKSKLKEGGYILLTVPAFKFLWSNHDEAFHHKRRYNIKQIKQILKGLNFKIIKASYIYFLLFPLIFFVRLFKKVFKNHSNIDDFQINNKFLNHCIIKLLSIERFLLNYIDYPFGSSILVLAEK